MYTVEPPNNGHIESGALVHCSEVVLIFIDLDKPQDGETKVCIQLNRQIMFTLGAGPLSIVRRLSLSRRVPFKCTLEHIYTVLGNTGYNNDTLSPINEFSQPYVYNT